MSISRKDREDISDWVRIFRAKNYSTEAKEKALSALEEIKTRLEGVNMKAAFSSAVEEVELQIRNEKLQGGKTKPTYDHTASIDDKMLAIQRGLKQVATDKKNSAQLKRSFTDIDAEIKKGTDAPAEKERLLKKHIERAETVVIPERQKAIQKMTENPQPQQPRSTTSQQTKENIKKPTPGANKLHKLHRKQIKTRQDLAKRRSLLSDITQEMRNTLNKAKEIHNKGKDRQQSTTPRLTRK